MRYSIRSPFEQLGIYLISLGLIPVFRFAGSYICELFFGFAGLYICELFFNGCFITILILALIVSYRINMGKKFSIFRIMFLIYLVLTFLSESIYYIGWFTDTTPSSWNKIQKTYEVTILAAHVFQFLAWILFAQAVIMYIPQPRAKFIRTGFVLLCLETGSNMIVILLDLLSNFIDPSLDFIIVYFYFCFNLLAIVLGMIGYSIAGFNFSRCSVAQWSQPGRY